MHPQGVDDVGRSVGVRCSHPAFHEAERPEQRWVSIPAATGGVRQVSSGSVALRGDPRGQQHPLQSSDISPGKRDLILC